VADLSDLRRRVRVRNEAAIRESSRELQQVLRVTSPHRSFRMRGETTVTSEGLTATALIDTEYASYVSEGTRPHLILPRRRRFLSWLGPQGRVFARRVHHPGTRANPWYRDGIGRWPVLLRRNLDRIRA
jgi:hypothetical protein